MPTGRPEEYLDPNSPNYDPNNPAAQGVGAPAQAPGEMPMPEQQGGEEALLQPIQEMSNAIVQIGGPQALAQVLQMGLQQLMQNQQPQGPELPSAAPAQGGEAFGPSYE